MEPTTQATQPHKMTGRTKGALWLLIGPTALLIVTFILFAIINWALAASNPEPTVTYNTDGTPTTLFSDGSTGTTVANVLLFCLGALGTIAWLPGLIVGIVLLATAKK